MALLCENCWPMSLPPRLQARPLSDAHNIWEIVLHIATWEDVVRRRLQG